MDDANAVEARAVDEPGLAVPPTYLVMAAVLAGGLVGLAAVLVWEPGWSPTQQEIASTGPFVLWVALIAAQTILWTVALPPLVVTFLRHWRNRRPGSFSHEVLPSAVGFVALMVVFVALPHRAKSLHTVPSDIIPHIALRLGVLTGLAVLVVLVAAMSIWLIRGRADALASGRSLTSVELRSYDALRSDLQWLLGYLGAVIGLAVLATAALRQFVVQVDGAKQFPPEVVILYGLILTLFVALIYLPTWATMQRTGSLLRDGIAPLPEPASEQLEAQIRKREAIDDLLGLRVSASVTFKAGVAILSPLLASLTTLLPKLGG